MKFQTPKPVALEAGASAPLMDRVQRDPSVKALSHNRAYKLLLLGLGLLATAAGAINLAKTPETKQIRPVIAEVLPVKDPGDPSTSGLAILPSANSLSDPSNTSSPPIFLSQNEMIAYADLPRLQCPPKGLVDTAFNAINNVFKSKDRYTAEAVLQTCRKSLLAESFAAKGSWQKLQEAGIGEVPMLCQTSGALYTNCFVILSKDDSDKLKNKFPHYLSGVKFTVDNGCVWTEVRTRILDLTAANSTCNWEKEIFKRVMVVREYDSCGKAIHDLGLKLDQTDLLQLEANPLTPNNEPLKVTG